MNLLDLIKKTAEQHSEFRAAMEADLAHQLQQYSLKHQASSEYEASTEVIGQILADSVGSLVETWIANKS